MRLDEAMLTAKSTNGGCLFWPTSCRVPERNVTKPKKRWRCKRGAKTSIAKASLAPAVSEQHHQWPQGHRRESPSVSNNAQHSIKEDSCSSAETNQE